MTVTFPINYAPAVLRTVFSLSFHKTRFRVFKIATSYCLSALFFLCSALMEAHAVLRQSTNFLRGGGGEWGTIFWID